MTEVDIGDFIDKFAEFVCWTIRMLYETKARNAGESVALA